MSQEHRVKIQNSNILNVLIGHAEGTKDMSSTQVSAALGLLKKVMPDLSATELSGEVTVPFVARVPEKATDNKSWQKRHAPKSAQK